MRNNSGDPARFPKELTVAEAAYLAGLTDGEGSVTLLSRPSRKFGPHQATATVSISNTNLFLLESVEGIIGFGHIAKATRAAGRRDCYNYVLMANAIRWLLPQILPYMIAKRRQAELVIEYLELIRGHSGIAKSDQPRAIAIKQELTLLNARGDDSKEDDPRCLEAGCRWRAYNEHPYCWRHWLQFGEKKKGVCRVCGKEMDLWNPEKQYCSVKCQQAWYYENVWKAQIEEERASRPKHPCPTCGTAVDRSRYKAKVYCSDRCQIKAYNDSRATREKAAPVEPGRKAKVVFQSEGAPSFGKGKHVAPRTVNCRICQAEFTSTHATQCYCSMKCQRQGRYLKKPAVVDKAVREVECASCHEPFETVQPNKKYCSQECQQRGEMVVIMRAGKK